MLHKPTAQTVRAVVAEVFASLERVVLRHYGLRSTEPQRELNGSGGRALAAGLRVTPGGGTCGEGSQDGSLTTGGRFGLFGMPALSDACYASRRRS